MSTFEKLMMVLSLSAIDRSDQLYCTGMSQTD